MAQRLLVIHFLAHEDHEKLHFKVRTAHNKLTTQGTSLGDFWGNMWGTSHMIVAVVLYDRL